MLASIGADLPQDLLAATGRYSGPLAWNVDRPLPRAEQWLESKFAPWAFSIVEDWAAGAFDGLRTIIFSRSDDSAHRLYYYVEELRRRGLLAGPEALVFDVAKIARPSSAEHMIASVRGLARRLDLSDAALERGIADTNARRAQATRSAALTLTCLLAGSPPPDRRLHAVIEAAGWGAVGHTLGEAWSHLGAAVAEKSGDPAAAIGRQLYAAQLGQRGFFDRGATLVREARAANASAVVLWCIEEDETQVWHIPEQRKALESAGLPALVLTRCNWRANDGVDVKISTFLKGLGL